MYMKLTFQCVCQPQKVLVIFMNEVLDLTAQIKDVDKRLNYSTFVLKKKN